MLTDFYLSLVRVYFGKETLNFLLELRLGNKISSNYRNILNDIKR